MAQPTFSPGDIVKLISGGPLMTVVKMTGNVVQCIWFNPTSNQYAETIIAVNILVKQTPFGNQ